MFRTYRSILRSIYKLCVAGLVCEDCVLLGASIRQEVVDKLCVAGLVCEDCVLLGASIR